MKLFPSSFTFHLHPLRGFLYNNDVDENDEKKREREMERERSEKEASKEFLFINYLFSAIFYERVCFEFDSAIYSLSAAPRFG